MLLYKYIPNKGYKVSCLEYWNTILNLQRLPFGRDSSLVNNLL